MMKQIDLTGHLHAGDNRHRITPVARRRIARPNRRRLLASRPFESLPLPHARQTDLLQINLQYDRTTLAVNDQLKCAVTVKNNTGQVINMAIVDLGIPPGFDVDTARLRSDAGSRAGSPSLR